MAAIELKALKLCSVVQERIAIPLPYFRLTDAGRFDSRGGYRAVVHDDDQPDSRLGQHLLLKLSEGKGQVFEQSVRRALPDDVVLRELF